MLCKIMAANCSSKFEKQASNFYDIYSGLSYFFHFGFCFWRKLHFTHLAYPKNPNLDMACTNYICERMPSNLSLTKVNTNPTVFAMLS